jgi:hypothetical protein
MNDKESRLRRMFFVDFPDQQGKTPPTATQWLDEMQLAQRRIGTPGMSFWQRGAGEDLPALQVPAREGWHDRADQGQRQAVSLQPFNPTQRAAEQQEVAMAVHTIQICGQAFPEEFKVKVDGGKTIENFVKIMRTDKIIEFRDPSQVQGAVDQIAKLVGGKQVPGGDPAAAAGAGLP